MPARPPWIDHFGDNFLWSNATLVIKGMAPYGVVALEEMERRKWLDMSAWKFTMMRPEIFGQRFLENLRKLF